MIVYRELSSLTRDLGFSAKALYSASFSRHTHYRHVRIPKENGGTRQLLVPDAFLKSIQRSITEKLLVYEEISPYACAYRYGGSTLRNAAPHTGKTLVLKLDFLHFFDHIIYPMIKDSVFPAQRYSEENRILLTLLCTYKDVLPQGAPTSPAISNIVMREFDNKVGAWCAIRGIAYTRYCDDMTFSGDFPAQEVISLVKKEAGKRGLFLNDHKTVAARQGQKQIVTGIVVNEKLSVSVAYRRQLRQDVYYCQKFGFAGHISRCALQTTPEHYARQLLGRVNYVLQISPNQPDMLRCRAWLMEEIKLLSSQKTVR